jgi:hypothetical protein
MPFLKKNYLINFLYYPEKIRAKPSQNFTTGHTPIIIHTGKKSKKEKSP